ncbi:MAG: hypothetical protein JXA25_01190 [Anaerolineales bacterium]|nr:hypothetical protein [Anaerolineales bacterium]
MISLKHSHLYTLAGLILLAFLVSSCDLPAPGDVCSGAELQKVELISPADFESVGTSLPTLSWNMPGDCDPGSYTIQLAKDRDMTVDLLEVTIDHPTTTWAIPGPLENAAEYWWQVKANVEEGGTLVSGQYSNRWRFYYGPTCDPAHQTNPVLVWPVDGETIDTVLPLLEWSYPYGPGCLPGGYRIELSTDPGLVDVGLNGGTGNPSTKWLPGDDLVDCTSYYWRVAPIVDIALGPYSESRSFFIDTAGSCAASPAGSLGGFVFHDLCAVPYSSDAPAPDGCVDLPDGGMIANGIYEEGEPGLEGVTVRLAEGSCPGTDTGLTALSAADGSYSFEGLSAGTFCLSINALGDGNDLVLIPGGWTYPESGDEPIMQEVTLGAGESNLEVHFGWDYQFLPSPAASEPSEPMVKALQNAHCRYGPDRDAWDDMAFLMEGETTVVEGRLADNSWFYVQNPTGSGFCWITAGVLEFIGPVLETKIVAAPAFELADGGIRGKVWHDLCAPPWLYEGTPPPPPEGCISTGGGGMTANGVLESGEPGISGVAVYLGSGSCNSTGLATAYTNSNGTYEFSGLAPGTYCVTVQVTPNANVLIPGGFSYPAVNGDTASHTVTVTAGNTTTGVSFGWDFQFAP